MAILWTSKLKLRGIETDQTSHYGKWENKNLSHEASF